MPRTKKKVQRLGRYVVLEKVTELYTLRQDLPDGRVIRHDEDNLWFFNGCAWYGNPPKEWDRSQAVFDGFRRVYEIEADYS